MEQGLKVVALVVLVLFISFCGFVKIRQARQWKTNVETDFNAALERMEINAYDLLTNRSQAPSRQRPAEVHRILRDQQGRYFLYLYSGSSPGVLQPLSEDRALLAVKMNG